MPKPNVLHLFVDQQRFDTIGALNNPVIKTPNLDRLYRSGVAFTNAYTPSPVCISARCSMIFGQYPANTGCYENTQMPDDGRSTFMDVLSENGYRTHGIGKCHFSPDPLALRGFQTREIQEEGGIRSVLDYPYMKYPGYLDWCVQLVSMKPVKLILIFRPYPFLCIQQVAGPAVIIIPYGQVEVLTRYMVE